MFRFLKLSTDRFCGGTRDSGGSCKNYQQGTFMECPECGHEADQHEFEEHVGDAPDLVGTYSCPECDHYFE